MKKILFALLILLIVLLTSCKAKETCPAYHHGSSAQIEIVISDDIGWNFKKKIKKIIMGKGDKRTKRGKLFSGTYGKSRPSKPVSYTHLLNLFYVS